MIWLFLITISVFQNFFVFYKLRQMPTETSDSGKGRNSFYCLLTIEFLRVTSLHALFSYLLSVSCLMGAKNICLQGIVIYFYKIKQ